MPCNFSFIDDPLLIIFHLQIWAQGPQRQPTMGVSPAAPVTNANIHPHPPKDNAKRIHSACILELPIEFNLETLYSGALGVADESSMAEHPTSGQLENIPCSKLNHLPTSEPDPTTPAITSESSSSLPSRPSKKFKADPEAAANIATVKKYAKQHRRRDIKAEERWKTHGHLPRLATKQRYVAGAKPTISRPLDIRTLPIKAGAYCAISRKLPDAEQPISLQAALNLGLVLVPWDGM